MFHLRIWRWYEQTPGQVKAGPGAENRHFVIRSTEPVNPQAGIPINRVSLIKDQ